MIIIETPIFTDLVEKYLSPDQYRYLQLYLAQNPESGDVIRGSGGLRRLRWKKIGKGKRGGFRIIYYWKTAMGQILMLFIYPKNKISNLSEQQIKLLKKIVDKEFL